MNQMGIPIQNPMMDPYYAMNMMPGGGIGYPGMPGVMPGVMPGGMPGGMLGGMPPYGMGGFGFWYTHIIIYILKIEFE